MPESEIRVGDSIELSVEPGRLHLFDPRTGEAIEDSPEKAVESKFPWTGKENILDVRKAAPEEKLGQNTYHSLVHQLPEVVLTRVPVVAHAASIAASTAATSNPLLFFMTHSFRGRPRAPGRHTGPRF